MREVQGIFGFSWFETLRIVCVLLPPPPPNGMRENSTWIPMNSVEQVFWEQVPVEAHTGLRVQLCHLGFTPESSPSVFPCQNSPKQPKPTLPHHSTGRAGPPRDTIQTLQNYYVHCTVGNRDPKGQNDQRVEAMQREEELTQVFVITKAKKTPSLLHMCLYLVFWASPALLSTARPFQICLYRY